MRKVWLGVAALTVLCAAHAAQAALTQVANANCSHVGNLVTNGSFEDITGGGPPGGGQPNWRLWATGTTQNFVPFAVPNGWTSSGNANSYAVWGNDGGPATLRFSDLIPDGEYAMYFGNGGTPTVNLAPTFNANGSVTFAGTPTVAQPNDYPTPVTLSQTISTTATPAPQYRMSFWISGEGAYLAADPNGDSLGIFGFQMTNVLAGDPELFLAVPSAADNFLGKSKRYDFLFSPLNPNVDVSIKFINYGHFDLTAYGRSTSTEMVLDDVMINAVPEPMTLGTLLLAASWFGRRR
jgi:hypothetical protein